MGNTDALTASSLHIHLSKFVVCAPFGGRMTNDCHCAFCGLEMKLQITGRECSWGEMNG